MRKKIACWLLSLTCLLCAAGCRGGGVTNSARQGAEIEAVVAEVNAFTEELLGKVEGAADPAAGVDEAQKLLDSRKAELGARIAAARVSQKFRESEEARGKLLESEVDGTDRVSRLRTRHLDRWMRDTAFKAKLDKLVGDYRDLFGG